MPNVTPEAQIASKPATISEKIAKMVGLDPEKAAEIAKQRDQEAEVVRICKNNALETYNKLKSGEDVDIINLGIGKFDLSPTDNIRDLLPNFKKRIEEINPKPPQEQIDIWSNQIGESALGDKQFDVAVNWYNYITHDRLSDIENASYIGKMASFATTWDEKYDLGLALQQIFPQAETVEVPQETPIQAPPEPNPAETVKPTASNTEADDISWQAAAGISPATSEPKMPINAPLQPDASLFSSGLPTDAQPLPNATTPTATLKADVLPPLTPIEATPPSPAPIPIDTQVTGQLLQPKPKDVPLTDANGRPITPAPTIDEAIALGIIKDEAHRIPTTPPISSSEAELAQAA